MKDAQKKIVDLLTCDWLLSNEELVHNGEALDNSTHLQFLISVYR